MKNGLRQTKLNFMQRIKQINPNPKFLEFLETNYNLKIIIDKSFQAETNVVNENSKERLYNRKHKLAKIVLSQFNEVLDVLSLETQSKKLKKNIRFGNLEVNPETTKLVIDEIKTFEYLANYYFEMKKYGIDDPKELVKETKKGIIIKSKNALKKTLFNINIDRLLKKPKNKADEKNRIKLISFCLELEKKETFKHGIEIDFL